VHELPGNTTTHGTVTPDGTGEMNTSILDPGPPAVDVSTLTVTDIEPPPASSSVTADTVGEAGTA
jgi:hypothetical protein